MIVNALQPIWKVITVMVIGKGAVMSAVILGVLHSGLSDFDRALIIASVSATVTGVFTCFAAVLAVRLQRNIEDNVQKIKDATVGKDE